MDFQGLRVTVLDVAFAMLSLALFLAFVRLVRGPSLADRVVALDLLSVLAAGMMALYAIAQSQAAFLDVAVVMSVTSFLGTVAFARYLEKGAK